MLTIHVPAKEFFNEATQEFIELPAKTLDLEHSLASLSKWEQTWEKPFLGDEPKTDEQTYDYVRCMNLTPDVDPEVFRRLSNENIGQVSAYVKAERTATWFNERPGTRPVKKETITAELIYYWMVALTIPFECQYWHLNTLLTLVKVCNQKNSPDKKKMSKTELAQHNRRLNEERRKKYGTSG